MNGQTIFNMPKQVTKILQWLYRGSAKDAERIALDHTINFSKGEAVTANGFQLQICPHPLDMEGTYYFHKTPTDQCVADEVDCTYPLYEQTIPQGEPTFEIWVNPDALKSILTGMDTTCKLTFYASHSAMEIRGRLKGTDQAHGDAYALLMPMYSPESDRSS